MGQLLRKFIILVSFCGIILISLEAFSVQEVVFRKSTMVFEDRNKDSNVLTVYEKGERAPISNKEYGDWRKVVVTMDEGQKVGWVLFDDIKDSKIIERNDPFDSEVYHLNKWAVGILGAFNFTSQGARDVNIVGTSATARMSGLNGSEIYFGLSSDFFTSSDFAWHAEVLFRSTSISGSGQFIPGGNGADVTLEQTYISLDVMAKWYLSSQSNFWYGAGLEVAKMTESKVRYRTTNITIGDEFISDENADLPIMGMVTVGFGLDLHVVKRFFATPTIRGGVIVTASPMAFTFEVVVPFVYTF